jgi:tetratricopeptide (TPR) repeat protein
MKPAVELNGGFFVIYFQSNSVVRATRIMSFQSALLVLTAYLSFMGPAAAETGDWAAGEAAFAAGDYETALSHFENARDNGLEGPAVHYNIAVSQYKLERYADAGETFQLIATRFPKMEGLAEYNLGLVANRQGRRDDAALHFLRAYKVSDDEKIQIMASERIREIEPEMRTASRWSSVFGIRAGNDDNIALRDEAGVPVGTTTESPMIDAFASVIGPRTGRDGLRFDGSAYIVKYADADEFDQSELRAGGFYEWRRRNWRAELGAHATTSTLGGDSFDRKIGGRIRLVRYLGDNNVVDLRYSYDDVSEGDDVFAGIAGWRQRIDTRYRWYHRNHRVQLRYVVETNDRLDPSVSPKRNAFIADYRFRPVTGFGYEAGVEVRNSNYEDIQTPRDEDLVSVFGTFSYTFANDWSVLLDFRQSENDSTDPTYSYDRLQLTLGALKIF